MPFDFIGSDGAAISAQGDVAQRLLDNDMNVNALRTNAVLRKDEWEMLDAAVVEVARERLVGVADLVELNLTFNVPNALGTTIIQHETRSEMTAAEISMDGVTKGQNDRVTFSLVSTPLPIIHHDFQITARNLASSRRIGTPLDTTQVEEATRQVAETTENLLFNGNTSGDILGFGSSSAQMFGYTNRTDRNTVSLATVWDDSAVTGATILTDVLSMITGAQADRMYGPYMLYVPTNYWVLLMDDFKAESDKTILDRLRALPGMIDVKVADKLADDNVILVQMTRSNVDLAVGMQPTTIQWETQGGMVMFFKVMSIIVPRIKLDHNGRSGVVHLS
jgi:uncharacterized linocin/CFP29 family protein